VTARQRHELGQGRDVSVDGEHGARHDQSGPPVRVAERPAQVIHVGVPIRHDVRAGQPATVHQRRRVAVVGEDELARPRERRDDAHGGQVRRAEQQR
jgi:hypothetical protein